MVIEWLVEEGVPWSVERDYKKLKQELDLGESKNADGTSLSSRRFPLHAPSGASQPDQRFLRGGPPIIVDTALRLDDPQ